MKNKYIPKIEITFPKLTNDLFIFEPSLSCFLL